jgi:hypothetical protein
VPGGDEFVRVSAGASETVSAQVAGDAVTDESPLDDGEPCKKVFMFEVRTIRKAQFAHAQTINDDGQAADVTPARKKGAEVDLVGSADEGARREPSSDM